MDPEPLDERLCLCGVERLMGAVQEAEVIVEVAFGHSAQFRKGHIKASHGALQIDVHRRSCVRHPSQHPGAAFEDPLPRVVVAEHPTQEAVEVSLPDEIRSAPARMPSACHAGCPLDRRLYCTAVRVRASGSHEAAFAAAAVRTSDWRVISATESSSGASCVSY